MNVSTQLDLVGLQSQPLNHLPVISLRMVREKTIQYGSNEPITSAKQAFEIFREFMADNDRESMWLACLDVRNKITCLHRVSEGTLNASLSHPREIYKVAVLSNSAHILLAHNHPSGDPSPSSDDISITRRIREAGDILGIKLLDHIIVGDDRFYSFAEAGGLGL